ncbi:MAG: hypothetical protein LBK74_10300 [Treponema sp.]|nr:hypothetical protein [Treponema sp.]
MTGQGTKIIGVGKMINAIWLKGIVILVFTVTLSSCTAKNEMPEDNTSERSVEIEKQIPAQNKNSSGLASLSVETDKADNESDDDGDYEVILKMQGLELRDFTANGRNNLSAQQGTSYLFKYLKNMRQDVHDMFLLTDSKVQRMFNSHLWYGRSVPGVKEPVHFIEYQENLLQFKERNEVIPVGEMTLDKWDAILGGIITEFTNGKIAIYNPISVRAGDGVIFYIPYYIKAEDAARCLFLRVRDGKIVDKKYLDHSFDFAIYDLGFFYSSLYDKDYSFGEWHVDDFKNIIVIQDMNHNMLTFDYKSLISTKCDVFTHVVVLPFVQNGKMGFSLLIGYPMIFLYIPNKGEIFPKNSGMALYKTYIADFANNELLLLEEGCFNFLATENFVKNFVLNNLDRDYYNLAFLPEGFSDTIQSDEFVEEAITERNVELNLIEARRNLYDESLLQRLIDIDK